VIFENIAYANAMLLNVRGHDKRDEYEKNGA
jgi:hypothetical protein